MKRGAEPHAPGSTWTLLLEPVVKRRREIALAAAASSVVAAAIFWMLPDRYISKVRLLPGPQPDGLLGPGSGRGAGIPETEPLFVPDPSQDESALYVEILGSEFVKDDVLEHLYDIPSILAVPFTLYDYFDVDVREQAYEKFAGVVRLSKDDRTGIVTLQSETTHPELSAQVAAQMISALARYHAMQRKTAHSEVARFLSQELEASHEELFAREEALAQFRSSHRNSAASDDPEIERDLGRLERDVELRTDTYMTLNQQYLAARIEAQRHVPSFQILDGARPATSSSGPRRLRGTLMAALATVLLFSGSLVAFRWLRLVLRPSDAAALKSMAREMTGDFTRAVNRVKQLSHPARSS